jgi:hypothetical protein
MDFQELGCGGGGGGAWAESSWLRLGAGGGHLVNAVIELRKTWVNFLRS